MVYNYENSQDWGDGYYSLIDRIYSAPFDWDGFGVKLLTLWFYGQAGNAAGATEQMYVVLEDSAGVSAVAEYPDMTDVQEEEWHEWNIAFRDFTGVDTSAVTEIHIGFGYFGGPVQGGDGTVYFDDIGLYPPRCVVPGPRGDLNCDCIVDGKDLRIMAQEWLQTGQATAVIHGDGIVNLLDYAVLANEWLEDGRWPP